MKKILLRCVYLLVFALVLRTIWLISIGISLSHSNPTSPLVDIASTAKLADRTQTWSAEVADFNDDGRVDILVVRHNDQPETRYVNTAKGYVSMGFGYPVDRHHCTTADVNLDELLDMFCSVGAERGASVGENNLYIKQADGTFNDLAAQYGVVDRYGRGRWSAFLNANGDEYPDLFIGNRPLRTDEHVSSNKLFINDNGKTFLSGESFGVDLPIGARCTVVTDFNKDGLDDLLICSEEKLQLYINQNGTHFDDASDRINSPKSWRRALLADLDGDDNPDLITLRGDRLALHFRKGDRFPELNFTAALENGIDVAVADADGDGDNDIFVVQTGCTAATAKKKMERLEMRNDFMLLNDGHGQFTLEGAYHLRRNSGCGGGVVAVDYDSDGRSEFLVLNGYGKSRGPLQLIQVKK